MTQLIPEDLRQVSSLYPKRLYTVAMPNANFDEVVSGIVFERSVSRGALPWDRVLFLRACGFQVHVYPFTNGLEVCWPNGFDKRPVAYVGDQKEAIKLAAERDAEEARVQAAADAAKKAERSALEDYKTKSAKANAAIEAAKAAALADVAATEAAKEAKENRAIAEKSAQEAVKAAEAAKAAASKAEKTEKPESTPEKKKKKGKGK